MSIKFKSWREIAGFIDHTLLSMDATRQDIIKLCDEAATEGFHAVCVNPFHVRTAAERLKGTGVKIVSVVSFPLGQTFKDIKVKEAALSVKEGADELDVVSNISFVKEGRYDLFKEEIEGIVREVRRIKSDIVVKVIIEMGYLTEEERKKAAITAVEAGADFIKTCTGKGPRGVTIEDVKLLRGILPKKIGIKAAGGIRSLSFMIDLIRSGANRIGTSSAMKIIAEAKNIFPDGV